MKGSLFNDYMKDLSKAMRGMSPTLAGGRRVSQKAAMERAIRTLCRVERDGRKAIFVGNGGSAAVASHQAIDYWKNGGIKAVSFNDGPLLTCLSNDYGYEHVFAKPIERFAEKGDLVFAISSSGRSQNIINASHAARGKKAAVITLSGFDPDNPLRKTGDINFYIPSRSYGIVEIAHLSICHSLLDHIIEKR